MTTDNQRRSRRQENRAAKVYGGKVTSGSGNTTGLKNDVNTVDLSIEFKTTKQKSYNLRLDGLRKAEKEALLNGREALFGIDFETGPRTFRYVVLSEYDYLQMREQLDKMAYVLDSMPVDLEDMLVGYVDEAAGFEVASAWFEDEDDNPGPVDFEDLIEHDDEDDAYYNDGP